MNANRINRIETLDWNNDSIRWPIPFPTPLANRKSGQAFPKGRICHFKNALSKAYSIN